MDQPFGTTCTRCLIFSYNIWFGVWDIWHSIIIGLDKFLGVGHECCLPNNLLHFLYDNGIFLWNQLINYWKDRYPIWKISNELRMADNLTLEWKHVCEALKSLGICREDQRAKMVWAGKMKDGNICVADVYSIFCNKNDINMEDPILKALRGNHIPIKIICFAWLVYQNKNLAWENLQRKNWHGPSYCTICKKDVEDNEHIFLKCQKVQQVWKQLAKYFWIYISISP